MKTFIKRLVFVFCISLLCVSTAYAIPTLNYKETYDGTVYTYDFTLYNDDTTGDITDLFIGFAIEDAFINDAISDFDFVTVSSPDGWTESYWGYDPGALNDPDNDYSVAWTIDYFSGSLPLAPNEDAFGFSISLASSISSVDFSWEWDMANVGKASPVPEPATMLLLSVGMLGLVGFRKKQKRN